MYCGLPISVTLSQQSQSKTGFNKPGFNQDLTMKILKKMESQFF